MLDNLYVEGSSPGHRGRMPRDSWQTRQLADGSSHRVIKNFPDEAELRQSIGGWATRASTRTAAIGPSSFV